MHDARVFNPVGGNDIASRTAAWRHSAASPGLAVLSLSGSFSSTWPDLAAECGLALTIVREAAGFDRLTNAVGVISAGGAEQSLESAFDEVGSSRLEIVAVGSLESHRIASAAVRAGAASYFALPADHELLRSWLCERADQLRSHLRHGQLAAGENSPHSVGIPFPATLAAITRNAAIATLALCGGNKSEAARRLGISRPRLQRILDTRGDDDAEIPEGER